LIKVIEASYEDSDSKDWFTVNFRSVARDQTRPVKKPPEESLSTDDIKIVETIIKVGTGVTNKDAMGTRWNSLKRYLQLGSRTFHLLTCHDISNNSTTMNMSTKYIKEFSSQCYNNKMSSVKTTSKAIGERYEGIDEQVLHARLNFKIAFYFEFQAYQLQYLHCYRQCYAALCDGAIEDLLDQVKAVAEIASFRVGDILLLPSSIGEAFAQFKAQKRFAKVNSLNLWLAYQYVMIAELMEMCNVSVALPEADRGYYCYNAARYTQKHQGRAMLSSSHVRKGSVARAPSEDAADACNYRSSFRGLILLTPRFVGSAIQFKETLIDSLQMDLPSRNTYSKGYLQDQDQKANYVLVWRHGAPQYFIAQLRMVEHRYRGALT
jgi:hypothetical protein